MSRASTNPFITEITEITEMKSPPIKTITITAAISLAAFTTGALLGYEQGAKDHLTGAVQCIWERSSAAPKAPTGRIKCWQSKETPAFKAAKPAILTEERLWK